MPLRMADASKTDFLVRKNDEELAAKSECEPKRKYKYIATFVIYFSQLSYGMSADIFGSSLIDIKNRLNTTTDNVSFFFAFLLGGYTLGALINGAVYNFVNRQLVLTALLLIVSCMLILAPHCPSLGLLYGVGSISGFGAGGIDTAQVVWTIELWSENSGSYLQGLQFFYAIGTFVSPLITKPFLAVQYESDDNHTELTTLSNLNFNTTLLPFELESNTTSNSTNGDNPKSRIEVPFSIVGALIILSSILMLTLHFYRKYEPPVEQTDGPFFQCLPTRDIIHIICGVFMIGPYVGMEIMNFQMIPAYAHYSHLKLTESEGATVLSFLAGFFTLGRGISIFIARKCPPEIMLLVNYSLTIIANGLLLVFELKSSSYTLLIVSSITLGIGFSSCFSAIYTFLEQNITITNTIGAIFVCSSGLSAAICPTLCGQFIEDYPRILIFMNFAITSISCLSFLVMNLIMRTFMPRTTSL